MSVLSKKGSSKVCGWIFSVWPSWIWNSQHASTGNSVSWSLKHSIRFCDIFSSLKHNFSRVNDNFKCLYKKVWKLIEGTSYLRLFPSILNSLAAFHRQCRQVYGVKRRMKESHMKLIIILAQSAAWGGAVEYIECFSAEEWHLPPQRVSWFNTKQSDGEIPAILKLWGMWSTPSLPLLPGPPWPGVVASDRVLTMGQTEQNCVLMLNWIVWNRKSGWCKRGGDYIEK